MKKNLIEYVYTATNRIFIFLKDGNQEKLIKTLTELENYVRAYNSIPDAKLSFKFGEDDTLITTINDINTDLSLPKKSKNREFLIERFELICKDINPKNEIKVFYN